MYNTWLYVPLEIALSLSQNDDPSVNAITATCNHIHHCTFVTLDVAPLDIAINSLRACFYIAQLIDETWLYNIFKS